MSRPCPPSHGDTNEHALIDCVRKRPCVMRLDGGNEEFQLRVLHLLRQLSLHLRIAAHGHTDDACMLDCTCLTEPVRELTSGTFMGGMPGVALQLRRQAHHPQGSVIHSCVNGSTLFEGSTHLQSTFKFAFTVEHYV
jgi:hypothetical protein